MLVVIVGATASGKTEVSLNLAQKMGAAEIVNGDAMQLYRGMDIGTAKVSLSERRGIKHHQIDVLDVSQDASVAAYQKHARSDISAIQTRNSMPLLVGGSGLYLRAVTDRIEFPGTDQAVRNKYEARLETAGPAALYQELLQVDPVAAERMDPANSRRIIRALEVIELTGQPYSANLPDYTYVADTLQIGIRTDLDLLDERIARRSSAMMQQGLVEETETLLAAGLKKGRTASRATGYAQALSVLAGEMTVAEATDAISLATRQLARRQIKWFRRDPRIHWLDYATDPDSLVERALDLIAKAN